MQQLKSFIKKAIELDLNEEKIKQEARSNFNNNGVYPESINVMDNCIVFLARTDQGKKLIIVGDRNSQLYRDFEGAEVIIENKSIKLVSMNNKNAGVLRRWFPFTAPVSLGKNCMSLGLGDRLGLANPGQVRYIKKSSLRPVLAQQSVREITLTERTFNDVMDAAGWAVFQEGYKDGFAADGDHLKTEEEVKAALGIGFTMITLDCSEKIDNAVPRMTSREVESKYNTLSQEYRRKIEALYLGKSFKVGDVQISFDDREVLQRIVLIYSKALAFIRHIYFDIIKLDNRKVDFEVSIDETETPTSPEAHFFVASELERMEVDVTSMAPRFIGEFQKAIDYIGDLERFKQEFKIHAQIADNFGYRLSIHSGSDKFRVFPVIGRYTNGRVHVKTAGTHWLEALKVIALKEPGLFRKIFEYAMKNFDQATKYYHVTTDLGKIPDITKISDDKLHEVMNLDDTRQMLHITYGIILSSKGPDGEYIFRNHIYKVLYDYEEDYYEILEQHIAKHEKMLIQNERVQ